MLKRQSLFVLMIFLLFAAYSSSYAYTDTTNHWAEKEINNMSANGIISGYTDGTFRPNQNMTRAELITVINRLLGNFEQSTKYVPDISVKDWYYVEVRKGIESGIVEGNLEGYVRPNALITREEAIAMIQRALVPTNSDVLVYEYSDFDEVSSWATKAISSFLSKGYIKGYSDNTIRPRQKITRAEVVTIISNIIDLYISNGEYKGETKGSVIVNGANVSFKDLTINGNLIVAEGASNFSLENVHILGNLIIRRDVLFSNNDYTLDGKKFNLYNAKEESDDSKYINKEYGISFSIPENVVVNVVDKLKPKGISNKETLITLRVNQSEELYFMSFEDGLNKEKEQYNSTYTEVKRGYIGFYRYALVESKKAKTQYIYIKRNNIEYVISFYNVDNENIVDNVINSISLTTGTQIDSHDVKVYYNKDLSLKFKYFDYVLVDDSYNTNVVNENQESYFKLFIQVNNIVDMSSYTVEQLKNILVALEDSDGEIIDSQIKKVYVYDAIEYSVMNNGKYFKSLYVIIQNKLYHFVFVCSEDKMKSAGEELFNDIINSVEF